MGASYISSESASPSTLLTTEGNIYRRLKLNRLRSLGSLLPLLIPSGPAADTSSYRVQIAS